MYRSRMSLRVGLGMLALGGAVGGAAAPAQADAASPTRIPAVNSASDLSLATPSGTCNIYRSGTLGDFCLWHLQNFGGSKVGLLNNTPDLHTVTFESAGSGQGARVAANAQSDWNYDSLYTVRIYTGTNYTGTTGVVPPQTGGNFNSTFQNKVRSFSWTR